MNYADIKTFDINNGEGVVVSLWVTGCPIHCEGCHNKEIWDPNTGYEFNQNTMDYILESLADERIDKNFSVLGGEPLSPLNYETVLKIVKEVKKTFPNKKIWIWTGYHFERLKKLEIFDYIDVLIEGPYVESLKDEDTWWRGSYNQKMIKLNP